MNLSNRLSIKTKKTTRWVVGSQLIDILLLGTTNDIILHFPVN